MAKIMASKIANIFQFFPEIAYVRNIKITVI